ncbi:MAG: hypothetical protein JWP61_2409 [Friedmanniella sp.]|nr:hypothetical protein [Friedmanniella sp.]
MTLAAPAPAPAPAPGTQRSGWLWPPLSVLTLVTYNTWVLWSPLNGNRAILDGYLSELAASDQPHSLVFRGGDLLTALVVGALGVRAVLGWRRLRAGRAGGRPSDRWWLVAALGLLGFGLATLFDAFLTMDCAPSLDAACERAEEAGRLSWAHYSHTVTSVAAQVGIVTTMVATFVAMLRSPQRGWRRRWVVLVVAVVEVSALAVLLILLVLEVGGFGYPQAVMVALASLWFAAVGCRLVGQDAAARPHPYDPPGPE